jgi:STE24 endopeptidase
LQRFAVSFGLGNIGSASSLPLIALIFGLFFAATVPFLNTLSRWFEGHCDQYALDLVEKPDAHISKTIKLCDQILRYTHPNPAIELLFYDYPSGRKRIESISIKKNA